MSHITRGVPREHTSAEGRKGALTFRKSCLVRWLRCAEHSPEQLNPRAEARKDRPGRGAAAPGALPGFVLRVPVKVNSHRQHLQENLEYSEGTQPTPKGPHVCGSFCLCFLNVQICSDSLVELTARRKAARPAGLAAQGHKATAVRWAALPCSECHNKELLQSPFFPRVALLNPSVGKSGERNCSGLAVPAEPPELSGCFGILSRALREVTFAFRRCSLQPAAN